MRVVVVLASPRGEDDDDEAEAEATAVALRGEVEDVVEVIDVAGAGDGCK
jgi:hypothetical protein